ncbi:MAG: hypothetical protein JWR40_3209 [Massilia sp.]|jgi:hypothetical protein|nr:hypothetical protein [Massilia sp.]MDB5950606.1 hypothetical protein [Massilia sp.]
MISRNKQIDLDDAAAGMILAAEVLDHQGSVLLSAGAALTEPLLTSMRRRGIDHVQVVDDSVSAEELAHECERAGQRLAHLFRRPGTTKADALLQAQVRAFRMEPLR